MKESTLISNDIIAQTERFFGSQTPLIDAKQYGGRPYEERSQQKAMAVAVAKAFTQSKSLCVEAPTGTGKSFAYLIPAIHYALKNKIPVIVTTETINLQEQLVDKDIPILQELLDVEFTAALAKGRNNYLCKRRLNMATVDNKGEYLPQNSMVPEIERISKWSNSTEGGTLADLSFEPSPGVWQCVCCENGNCFGPKCKFKKSCFYWQARKQWEKVDLLVVNHALFLTDLKIRMEEGNEAGILPEYCGVVIDEAHQLESSAAKHLGTRVSEAGLFYFLNKLFNSRTSKGLLIRTGVKAAELRQLAEKTYNYVSTFFNNIRQKLKEDEDTQKRIYEPYFVEDILTGQLALLERGLDEYSKSQDEKDYKQEIGMQILRCSAYKKAIFEFLMMNAEESVYWLEQENNHKKSVSLNYSPLNIATILAENLFSTGIPIVLTSATLSVANTFNFYKSRTGFTGEELILDTPFDYERQARIHVIKEMPEQYDRNYHDRLAHYIENYISHTHGKAFVLFTSYASMSRVTQIARPFFERKKINLFVQGEGISRSRMLTHFKDDIDSVIFGTSSFWMGVDVPGEALSNVIITKLPFSVPTEPLIEARLDKIKNEGGNPFMEYSLPEAVIKLKQGIGRLIRSKDDTGIITILDNRVITKRYGKIFLNSLPPCPIQIDT